MTDPLIDQLVADLSPRKPLTNFKLWMHCIVCLLLIAAMVLGFMGLRADYEVAIQNGALFWKLSIFIMLWIGSLLSITAISRPLGGLKKAHMIPFILAGVPLVWQFFQQTSRFSWEDMFQSLSDGSAIYCFSVITGGGSVAMVMAWQYWIKQTASRYPTLLGALAGLSAGSLAATAYSLHCNHDMVLYIVINFGAPVMILSLIGAVLGKKRLNW